MSSMKRLAAVSVQLERKPKPKATRKPLTREEMDAHFKRVRSTPAKKKPAPTKAQVRTQKAAVLRDKIMRKVPVAKHWYSSLVDALTQKPKKKK